MDSLENTNFDIPADVLDEIQNNIQNIIENFDIPDENKIEVIRKINFMYNHTRQMSITDSLTGLYNRRQFEFEFAREFKRAKRYKNDLSVAIIDIDFFKKINDTYGHLCGDYVLKEAAYLMYKNFRQTDFLYRYGGEEFIAVLTETSGENAIVPLERLRLFFENHEFKYKEECFKVTVSIGVSSKLDFDLPFDMLENADKALYIAKENGRNQVVNSNLE